jgi:membrane protein
MKIFKVFKKAYKEWMSRDPFRESAIIAYYSIFSLPGLFVVIITLAGLFFGQEAASGYIQGEISGAVGEESAGQIQSMIQSASEKKNSVIGAVIGIGTLLFGATGVFAQFQKSLNIIWEVKANESKSGIWKTIKVRLFSFGLILSIGFLLIVSLFVSTLLATFGGWLTSRFSESLVILLVILNIIVSIGILSVLFALMLKFFPDAEIKWKDVWIGSIVTAVLFQFGKYALSLYFSKANPGTGYGAAGSIVLILLWVSYSSMIVFYGAEFTRAWTLATSGDRPPSELAEKQPGRGKGVK